MSTTSVLRTEYHPSTVRCLAIPREYNILRARPRAVPSAVLARSPPLFIFRDGLFDCTRRVAAVGCTLTFFCASCIAVVSGVGPMPVGIRSTAFRMFPRRHRPSYTDANLRALTTSYRTPCVPCCERCRGAHRVGRTTKSTRRPQKMTRGPRLGKLPTKHPQNAVLAHYYHTAALHTFICFLGAPPLWLAHVFTHHPFIGTPPAVRAQGF